MAWREATFKDNKVLVEVDGAGQPAATDGRVAIRYDGREGATIYRAAVARVSLIAASAARELPPGVDADARNPAKAAPKSAAKGATKGAAKGAGRGSGFGKAGTRSEAQATAAAADARTRIASLPAGTVIAYTDGACRGNPGPAGSGVVVVLPDGRRAEASRSLGRGTNNIAELTAIGMALDLLDAGGVDAAAPVAIFSDSSYADGVLTRGWKAKANAELIAELKRRLRARPGVTLQWVAGHVGVEGNERADALANAGVAGTTATRPF